jgi:lambda repressor-like predicted transcriptional regulator
LEESVTVIAERLRTGASIRTLSVEYGVSQEAIRRAAARSGVEVATEPHQEHAMPLRRVRLHRLPGRGRSRSVAPEEIATLLARRQAGESIRSLARTTGVSHESMRRTLVRAGCDDEYGASA